MNHNSTSNAAGSLLIAWQLKNKRVLIVGGGEVASQRIESILVTDVASIVVLCPSDGLGFRAKRFIGEEHRRVTHWDRKYSGPSDLVDFDMVLTALDDVDISKEIVRQCRSAKIPVNAADIPEACDFYFGAQIRDGPLQIMISTNGNGPRMAVLVKRRIMRALTGSEGEIINKVGILRQKLKEQAPGVGGEVGRRRMKWMTDLCNTWEMEELAQLDEGMMDKLLQQGWQENVVPSVDTVGGIKRRISPLPSPRDGWFTANTAIAFLLGSMVTAGMLLWRQQRR